MKKRKEIEGNVKLKLKVEKNIKIVVHGRQVKTVTS